MLDRSPPASRSTQRGCAPISTLPTALSSRKAVMMGLAPHLGRGHAHDLVQALCAEAIEQRRPLFDILARTPEITRHVDADALRKLCDPTRYLGLSGVMVDRVLARLP